MKTLVVFYSKTGRTRRAAQQVAALMKADLEELVEIGTIRTGLMGFIRSGRDAMQKRSAALQAAAHDPSAYDLVIVCSPIWAFTLCPAVRSYLMEQAGKIRKAAFLCTHGGGGPSRSCADAESLLGKPLMGTLALRDKAVDGGQADEEMAAFVRRLSG